jgi:hypothetical protein
VVGVINIVYIAGLVACTFVSPPAPLKHNYIYSLPQTKGYISITLPTHTYIYPLSIGNIEENMTPKKALKIWKATSRVSTSTRHATWMKGGK